MTLIFLKNSELSWQDRTLNIELMMSPSHSQLIYNKHKGLASKCDQEHSYLQREKRSYLRSYETDKRLMEMRKEGYEKKKSAIHHRRQSLSRQSKSPNENRYGRNSAPPRLNKDEKTFLTKFPGRETKSAEAETYLSSCPRSARVLDGSSKATFVSPRSQFTVSAPVTSVESKSAQGPPYLGRMGRQRSVRFLHTSGADKTDAVEQIVDEKIETPIEDRIKDFFKQQAEFNKRQTEISRVTPVPRSATSSTKRNSGPKLNVTEIEKAFDSYCINITDEGYRALVRYAAKMKANIKLARY